MVKLVKQIADGGTLCGTAPAPHLPPDCTYLNFGFSALVLLAATLLIIVLQPLTTSVECGDSELVNGIEDWIEDIFALLTKAASATVMVVANYSIHEWVMVGVGNNAVGMLVQHMKLFFAISATLGGALLSSVLERLELRARKQAKCTSNVDYLKSGNDVLLKAYLQLSDLVQLLLGFLASRAWTSLSAVYFPTLNATPSPSTVLSNLLVAVSMTLLAIVWLVSTGETTVITEDEKADRSEVEKQFIASTLYFICGWVWYKVAYGAIAQSCLLATAQHLPMPPFVVVRLTAAAFTIFITALAFTGQDKFVKGLARFVEYEVSTLRGVSHSACSESCKGAPKVSRSSTKRSVLV
uniref:Transmembrane protein n=1 Tax=Haptolina ericina TaxID=156174 RepID=A0A7S3B775_9EUKA|mmetsp:Transcript_52991/g.118911  ORF Transcript_52991/g.118911 Transcript_52991/m.118911 type:complete len:353 (+) Transcript_52991:475-1533(+)